MGKVPSQRVGLRHMRMFSCLGSACKETCCSGWTIEIDREHYVQLRRVLGHGADKNRIFARLPDAQRTRERFAELLHNERGFCNLLGRDNLCTIHKQLGENFLPDVCAGYPRVIHKSAERLELAGQLSCPEIARLLLLAEGATDVVPIAEARFGRPSLGRTAAHAGSRPDYMDTIRDAMYRLAGKKDYDTACRKFFMLGLADRLDTILKKLPVSAEELHLEISQLENPEFLDEKAETFRNLLTAPQKEAGQPALRKALEITLVALKECAPIPGQPRFASLLAEVLSSFDAPTDPDAASHAIFAAYRQRRALLLSALPTRLELYIQNYCQYFWFKERIEGAQSLHQLVQVLLVRLAMFRFLLFGHPQSMLAAQRGDSEALDLLAVEVAYALARYVEHSEAYSAFLLQLLKKEPNFADSIALILL